MRSVPTCLLVALDIMFYAICQYFANLGYKPHEDVRLNTPTKIEPQEEEEEEEAAPELRLPDSISQNIAQTEEPIRQDGATPPPLPPSGPRQRRRPPVPRSTLPPTPAG